MAVEPTNENESAAALQDSTSEALLTDADLEQSPTKRRKVHKHVYTFMCMLFLRRESRVRIREATVRKNRNRRIGCAHDFDAMRN